MTSIHIATTQPGVATPVPGDSSKPVAGSPQSVENRLLIAPGIAERLRGRAEGMRVRRCFAVRSVAPGLVSVRIMGRRADFGKVGLACVFDGHAGADEPPPSVKKHLDYVAVDQRYFAGRVVVGDGLLDASELAACTGSRPSADAVVVRVNGGYFNYLHRASAQAPEHAAIGQVAGEGGRPGASIPVPATFAADYQSVWFEDGSLLSSAPVLGNHGMAVFAGKAQADPNYHLPKSFSFDQGGLIPPGHLWHAHDANPRAALSLPKTPGTGVVRLVAARMPDRAVAASGYSLHAFSRMMARLDRLDLEGHCKTVANWSLNLDGGESLLLQAWTGGQRRVDVRQASQPRSVGNFIEFTPRRVPRADIPAGSPSTEGAGYIHTPL